MAALHPEQTSHQSGAEDFGQASSSVSASGQASYIKAYNYLEEALCNAASEGRLNAMMRLLHERIDINCRDAIGYTPLHHAVAKNQFDAVKLLLCNKAQVDPVTWAGVSPLHLAARNDHLRVAKLLIFAGANHKLVCRASGCLPRDLAAYNSPMQQLLDELSLTNSPVHAINVPELFELPSRPSVPAHTIPRLVEDPNASRGKAGGGKKGAAAAAKKPAPKK